MSTEKNAGTIGQRVKFYRKSRGLSQDELAEGICSRQTISLLENEQHIPSVEFLHKISRRLGISLHDIMVDHVSELEINVQLDIIKVYIETGDYSNAFPLLEKAERHLELLDYQKRQIVLCRAECFMRTGRSKEAIELLSKLQHEIEMQHETDDHFLATLHNKLGNAYYLSSNMLYAHSHYVRAYQISSRFPETDLLSAQINYNLGNVCIWMGNYVDAHSYLSFAQEFFNKISDPSKYATTLFSIGLAYHGLRDFENADSYLQEALTLFSSLKVSNMAQRARQQYASLVLAQQNPQEAIKELLECAEEFRRVGDRNRLAYTYAHVGSLHLDLKSFSEAGHFLKLAMELFDEEDAMNDPRCIYVYRIYSRYLLCINEIESSIEFALKSSDFFDKMGIEREAADSLQIVAEGQRKKGNYELAFETMQRVTELLRRSQDKSILRERRNYH